LHTGKEITTHVRQTGEGPGCVGGWYQKRLGEVEEEEELPDPYASVGDDVVRQISAGELEELVFEKQTKTVIGDFSYSWCFSATRAQSMFINAARQLSSQSVVFVRVDSKEYPAVARHYDVSCGLQSHVYVLRKGEGLNKERKVDSEEIVVPAQESEFMSALRSRFEAKLVHITTEDELNDFKKSHNIVAIAIFDTSKGGNSAESLPEFQALTKAATVTRGLVPIGYIDRQLGGYVGPSVKVFKHGKEMDGGMKLVIDGGVLARMIGAEAFPLVSMYEYGVRESFDRIGIPIIQVFGHDKDTINLAQEVAKEYRGRLGLVRMSPQHYYMLEDHGMDEKSVPGVGITDSFHWNSMKYAHDGEMTVESVRATVDKYLAGTLPPSFKSEKTPPPGHHDKGTVKKVVKNTLSEVVGEDSQQDTLIMVYRPWMHTLKKARQTLAKVAEAFKELDRVTVASLDVSGNFFDRDIWRGMREMEEDPCIYMCPRGGGGCKKFYGQIAQKEIFQFAAKNSQTVKQQWDDKVKPQLKAMKKAESEAKEAAKKDSARRALEYEEEVKGFNDKVEKADELEIAAGVWKRVAVHGDSKLSPPRPHDQVKVHYTGTLASNGQKFDSSRDRGKPFTFTMGIQQVIPCWEKGVSSMVPGERAQLICDHKQAYGDRGAPPKIPEKAKLLFDVELLSTGPPSVHDEM